MGCFATLTIAAVLRVAAVDGSFAETTAVAPAAQADEAEAFEHFQAGVSLFEEGDFEAALFKFKLAYEQAPNYRLWFNIAGAQLELHDYAGAATSFRRYLEEGGDGIEAERREQVDSELTKLEGRVGVLMVNSDPSGSSVWIDGVAVGTTPLEWLVNLGTRRIEVSADGYQTSSSTVSVPGGQVARVAVTLTRVPLRERSVTTERQQTRSDSPSPLPKTSAGPSGRGLRTGTWVATGIAGAAGIASLTTGILALRGDRSVEEMLDEPATRDSLDSTGANARALAVATDVLIAVGVTAAATAVVLGILSERALRARSGGQTPRASLVRSSSPTFQWRF